MPSFCERSYAGMPGLWLLSTCENPLTQWGCGNPYSCGYGSIPKKNVLGGMNIHVPAILMWTKGAQGNLTHPHVLNITCLGATLISSGFFPNLEASGESAQQNSPEMGWITQKDLWPQMFSHQRHVDLLHPGENSVATPKTMPMKMRPTVEKWSPPQIKIKPEAC